MPKYVESLKRLFDKGYITELYINDLFAQGKLTQEEHDYILGV